MGVVPLLEPFKTGELIRKNTLKCAISVFHLILSLGFVEASVCVCVCLKSIAFGSSRSAGSSRRRRARSWLRSRRAGNLRTVAMMKVRKSGTICPPLPPRTPQPAVSSHSPVPGTG